MKRIADTVINSNTGRPIQNALVELLTGGAPVTIYTDNAMGGAAVGMYTNANGLYTFYAPDGAYTLRISYGGETISLDDIEIYDDSEDRAKTARALLVPPGETGPTLPAAADRTGKFLQGTAGGGFTFVSGTGADANLRTDLSSSNGASLVEYDGSTVKAALDENAGWRAGYCLATQAAPVGGSGVQVEIAHADIVMETTGPVMLTARMCVGPVSTGAIWNTHFEIDLDGVLRSLVGFTASSRADNFTNIWYGTLTEGTHRVSLFWYGQNGLIGVGGDYLAVLIGRAL